MQRPAVLFGRDGELAWCAQTWSRHRVLAIFGLAGIGKTSLVLAAAHEQARTVAGSVAYHACADTEPISDVLAALVGGEPAGSTRAGSLRSVLDRLVARAQSAPLVLCIDDAHRISDPLLLDVLAYLGAVIAPIWVVVASRRHLPLPERDINGAILRLGPLQAESARALWFELEHRFGPSLARFDDLDPVQRGSPFALRRAFATGVTSGDHDVDLSGLAPPHAALLAQICAFSCPVDAARLTRLVPACATALPALIHALLVEVTQAGVVTVHDLVRASVARSAQPPGPAEHLVCLRFYEADHDLLARLRHTVGAQHWAAAIELIDQLVRPHYGLFPLGAAVEVRLLAALDALHAAQIALPLPVRLARLQIAARHGRGRAALDELRSEAAREPAAWPHLGTVELLLGDATAAELHIRQALADPSLAVDPVARMVLLAVLLEILRTQGLVDRVSDELVAFERAVALLGPIGTGVGQLMVAAIAYDREDYQDAAVRLAAARPYIAMLSFVPALHAIHVLLERAARAALASSPEDALPASAVTRALFEDVDFLRATLLLFAADGDVLEGNVADAELRASDAEAIAVRSGYRGLQHWAVYVRAACLRMRGFAEDAAALAERSLADPLTRVHRRQRYLLQAVSALSLAQLGRMHDARDKVGSLDDFANAPVNAARLSILPWIHPEPPSSDLACAEFALAQLGRALDDGDLDQALRWAAAAEPVRASRWQYLRAQLAVLDAELAVRIGDAAQAERALADAETLCSNRGYRREHATAALIAIAHAQLIADPERARSWARTALARARGIAADAEAAAAAVLEPQRDTQIEGVWARRLELTAPRLFRMREPTTVHYLTKRQAEAARLGRAALGVDVMRHVVHVAGTARSLANRPSLWSVLSALLAEPGRVVSPDAVAQSAWGVKYHAIRHRSRLVVSIKRLRDALGSDLITAVDGGYRLSAHPWAVLEPTAPSSERPCADPDCPT